MKTTDDLIDFWRERLLSGDYRQGTRMLCSRPDPDKPGAAFCCLGVLAHSMGALSPELLVDLRYWEERPFLSPVGRPRDGEGIIINGRTYRSLAQANDCGVSFEDIAEWLRTDGWRL